MGLESAANSREGALAIIGREDISSWVGNVASSSLGKVFTMFKSVSRSTALLFLLVLAAFAGTILSMTQPQLIPAWAIASLLATVGFVGARKLPSKSIVKAAHIALMALSAVMFIVVALTSPNALMFGICLFCFLVCMLSYGLLAAQEDDVTQEMQSLMMSRTSR